jgi:hypothetical protein
MSGCSKCEGTGRVVSYVSFTTDNVLYDACECQPPEPTNWGGIVIGLAYIGAVVAAVGWFLN